jgi:predicted Zn-dependent peptidase
MISRSILDNGVRIITERIPHSHSVSIGIWVNSGSRHEDPASNGIAHFIEHLLFKGTDRRSALDIAREIDGLGGVLNAFTGREYVCYYAKVLDRYLPRAADLLTDIFLNSRFSTDEIDRERQVILQEIGMLEDSPDDYIHDLLHQSFWQGHPLGMSVIGCEQTISTITRDTIIGHRESHYRADDILVAAAGNLKHEQVVSLFEALAASIPSGRQSRQDASVSYSKRINVHERELEQVHLCLGTPGLTQSHPRRFEGYVLNTILGASMSSRLFQEVREKAGLAYSIYSYLASHSDEGSLVIYAGTSPDRLRDLIHITMREISRLRHETVTADQLSSAREQLKGNLLLSLESSDSRMTKLAKNEIYFGCYQEIDEIMAGFDSVTAESLQQLAFELLDDRFITLELMGRLGSNTIGPELLVT